MHGILSRVISPNFTISEGKSCPTVVWFFFLSLKVICQLSKIIKGEKKISVLCSFQTEMELHWSGSTQECKDCKDARGITWRLFQDWNTHLTYIRAEK